MLLTFSNRSNRQTNQRRNRYINITDINTFKKRLKTVLIDRAYTDLLLLLYKTLLDGSYSGAPYKSSIVLYCITSALLEKFTASRLGLEFEV